MAKSYRADDRGSRSRAGSGADADGPFRCRHCKVMVGLLPSGGRHRNHCPFCLYSRHVDTGTPGDRASACGSSMQPVGRFTRRNGEDVIVHRCLGCGQERWCRIGADDDYDLVLSLPEVEARQG